MPKSMAKGERIHNVLELFRVKTTEKNTLDRRAARVVVVGTRMRQGKEYLEHFSAGAQLGGIRFTLVSIVEDNLVRFAFDVRQAFPHEKIERKIFI